MRQHPSRRAKGRAFLAVFVTAQYTKIFMLHVLWANG